MLIGSMTPTVQQSYLNIFFLLSSVLVWRFLVFSFSCFSFSPFSLCLLIISLILFVLFILFLQYSNFYITSSPIYLSTCLECS